MKVDTKFVDRMLKNNLALKPTLLQRAYQYFVSITPYRKGNARRNTHLVKDEIRASYPYAKRLDEGWSKQAPDGMIKPTFEFLKKEIKKLLKGK